MANIIITKRCNLSCPYCFALDMKKEKYSPHMTMTNFDKAANFLTNSNERELRLMGGEPTLHPLFRSIVEYALKCNFQVQVFTNGIFDRKILTYLVSKKDKIKYSFNINEPFCYSDQTWQKINKNIEKLAIYKKCLIGSVVYKPDFTGGYLLKIAKNCGIKVIMLRIANPIFNKKNKFAPKNLVKQINKSIIEFAHLASENNIQIGFGCGMSRRMFTGKQLSILGKCKAINLKWGCQANTGKFDIDTDLTVVRCLPLYGWQKEKLLKFKNSQQIKRYFIRHMKQAQRISRMPDCINKGPCFARLIN